jgi:hypothetical protein
MPDTKTYFGIVLELNGEVISLSPKTAITEIKTEGIDVGLLPDQTIEFGKVGENLKSILDSLGVSTDFLIEGGTPENPTLTVEGIEDIEALNRVVQLLFNAELAVEEFHVRVPPSYTLDSDGTTLVPIPKTVTGPTGAQITNPKLEKLYTLGLSATWTGNGGELVSGLNLKGVYFKVSNENR